MDSRKGNQIVGRGSDGAHGLTWKPHADRMEQGYRLGWRIEHKLAQCGLAWLCFGYAYGRMG